MSPSPNYVTLVIYLVFLMQSFLSLLKGRPHSHRSNKHHLSCSLSLKTLLLDELVQEYICMPYDIEIHRYHISTDPQISRQNFLRVQSWKITFGLLRPNIWIGMTMVATWPPGHLLQVSWLVASTFPTRTPLLISKASLMTH